MCKLTQATPSSPSRYFFSIDIITPIAEHGNDLLFLSGGERTSKWIMGDYMKKIILVSLLLVLGGCATVKETYSPDGRKAYTLNCSGTARGWDKCYAAAGELCKDSGYDILDRSSEDMSTAAVGGNVNRSGGSFGGSSVKTNERSMVIACKGK